MLTLHSILEGQLPGGVLPMGQCSPGIGVPQSGDRYKVYNDEANRRNASFDTDTSIVEVRWDISDSMKFDYILGFKNY